MFNLEWDIGNNKFINEGQESSFENASKWHVGPCNGIQDYYFVCDGFSENDTLIPTIFPTYNPTKTGANR